ncbi:MAG: hypothetical protein DMG65_15965 [Candidatus Angelobacter sp. Gp1-AA117]|nr:MAG: hypothetical protein DMG65_15965 [Candidatus Angelobacter sp. Gp1-AA117]
MQLSRPIKSALARMDGEVLLRFLVAVVGLILAFFSAILSTVARESGNVGATVLFASTALLLAGTVGLITVPYLTRRVAVAQVRDALDFEVTREGLAYLGVAMVIGIAALNTTNNLLFIVLAAMLAAIAVSGFASAAVLRGLELDVDLGEIAFAGKAFTAQFKIHNPRRWIPAFSVRVVLQPKKKKKNLGLQLQKTEFVFPRQKSWVRLTDYKLVRKTADPEKPTIFNQPVYFTFIPPHTSTEASVELNIPRRGRYSHDHFQLATRFPFSFLTKSRRVPLQRDLLVYPALLDSQEFLELIPVITGEFTTMMRGYGSELYRIREHTPEDPARFVDWKATAKTGALKVREFTREDDRRMRIVFDNPVPGQLAEEMYEYGVSMAASLAWHFTGQNVELSYAAPGYGGEPFMYDFWCYLALVQPARGESILDSLPVSSDFNVIITPREPGSIPATLRTGSYIIYI